MNGLPLGHRRPQKVRAGGGAVLFTSAVRGWDPACKHRASLGFGVGAPGIHVTLFLLTEMTQVEG